MALSTVSTAHISGTIVPRICLQIGRAQRVGSPMDEHPELIIPEPLHFVLRHGIVHRQHGAHQRHDRPENLSADRQSSERRVPNGRTSRTYHSGTTPFCLAPWHCPPSARRTSAARSSRESVCRSAELREEGPQWTNIPNLSFRNHSILSCAMALSTVSTAHISGTIVPRICLLFLWLIRPTSNMNLPVGTKVFRLHSNPVAFNNLGRLLSLSGYPMTAQCGPL